GVWRTAPGNTLGDRPVSDLRTLKRGRGGPRIRCVQGRLSMMFEDEETPGAEAGASENATDRARTTTIAHSRHTAAETAPRRASHPPAYRGVVAGWPEDW